MLGFWNNKRVFVTGHTGFKGSWLALWLNSLGADVCGYALPPDTDPNLFDVLTLDAKIRSIQADIRDLDALRRSVLEYQPEIIFHLAAESLVRRSYRMPVDTYSTNVMGTVHLLEAVRSARSTRAVVVVTTDKVYENKEKATGYIETDRLGGFDPYASSKACAELVTAAYRDSFFADTHTLVASARAGNVIGGGDWSEDRLLPDVFRSLIFGDDLKIRSPDAVRPWQHVFDPLFGYMVLAQSLYEGHRDRSDAWNFGPGDENTRTVGSILNEIGSIWDGEVSWDIDRGDRPHETIRLELDSSKARKGLDWVPKLRLEDALKLTVEWYRAFRDKEDLVELSQSQIKFYQENQCK